MFFGTCRQLGRTLQAGESEESKALQLGHNLEIGPDSKKREMVTKYRGGPGISRSMIFQSLEPEKRGSKAPDPGGRWENLGKTNGHPEVHCSCSKKRTKAHREGESNLRALRRWDRFIPLEDAEHGDSLGEGAGREFRQRDLLNT